MRNNGQWTESRFHSFIVSGLRQLHSRWGPKCRALSAARVRRGWYRCTECGLDVPSTIPAQYKSGKKKGLTYRKKNAVVDHIKPVVDPHVGFTNWDEYIAGMFQEDSGYQVLCDACHTVKCAEERAIATARKRSQ